MEGDHRSREVVMQYERPTTDTYIVGPSKWRSRIFAFAWRAG